MRYAIEKSAQMFSSLNSDQHLDDFLQEMEEIENIGKHLVAIELNLSSLHNNDFEIPCQYKPTNGVMLDLLNTIMISNQLNSFAIEKLYSWYLRLNKSSTS